MGLLVRGRGWSRLGEAGRQWGNSEQTAERIARVGERDIG